MKKNISILTVLALVLFGCISVNAKVIVDEVNSTITLGGTTSAKSNIGIEVFAPGKSYIDIDDMELSDFKSVLPCVFQVTADEDGQWEKSFKLSSSPSGRYTVLVCDESTTSTTSENFVFVNINDGQPALKKLLDAYPDKNSVMDILGNEAANLGLSYDFIDKISMSRLAELIINEIQTGNITDESFVNAINRIRRTSIINAIDVGLVSNLFDYDEILEIDNSTISDYYKTTAIVKNYANITQNLKNNDFKNVASFYQSLEEKTVLNVVANPDGVDDVKNIINEFSSNIGTTVKITDSICRKIMGKSYSNYSALSKAIKAANTSTSSSSGGGGGGGGSSSSKSSTTLSSSVPVVTATESEVAPIEYDIFTDIDDVSWAKDAIVFLAQSGIIKGKSDNEFYPNDNITREEITTIISRAFCSDCEEAGINFIDVPNDSWYYSPVAKAVACNIIKGQAEQKFGAGEYVSRQDMVTMVYRVAEYKGIALESGEIGFIDENQIADYAKDAVAALTNADIVNGIDLYTFAPNETATRAQVAKVIYKLSLLQ